MRIVFFGTPDLAVPSLAALHDTHDVVALVCQPDRAQGRSKTPVPPPTKAWAEAHDVPVHQPTKLNDGTFEAWLREQRPDICALVAYGRILKQPILNVPRHGFLNVHPSRLPKYRGPSPIQTAILEGQQETAVTIMRLDAGMDSGDILLQENVPIAPDDTTASLTQKTGEIGARMLVQAVGLIERGEAQFTPQDDSAATYTRMFTKEDGRIDWSAPAHRIVNRIRAAIPWPVAFTHWRGQPLRIHAAQVEEGGTRSRASAPPGTVIAANGDALIVATGDSALHILKLQAPGKRVMTAGEFLRGNPLRPGDTLGGA